MHNLSAHFIMVDLSWVPTERCSVTGRSLFALRKIGRRLTVDRIDSMLGYVEGNMQLLTDDLNSAKGNRHSVPWDAINRLIHKLDGTVHDCHSQLNVAVHRD
jgi:hypothetical protein